MEVAREQLADAIRRTAVRAREGGLKYLGDGTVSVHPLDPDGLAGDLLSDCAGHAADDEFALTAVGADLELSFLAFAVQALDDMGDLAVARVMAYLSDRYPPDE